MATSGKNDGSLTRLELAKTQVEGWLKAGNIKKADAYLDQLDNPKQAKYAKWILERVSHPHAKKRLTQINTQYFAQAVAPPKPAAPAVKPAPPKAAPPIRPPIENDLDSLRDAKPATPPRKKISSFLGGLLGFLITQALLIGVLKLLADNPSPTPLVSGRFDADPVMNYIKLTGFFTLSALLLSLGPGLGVLVSDRSNHKRSSWWAGVFGFLNIVSLWLTPYALAGTLNQETVLTSAICLVLIVGFCVSHITSLLGIGNLRGYSIWLLALFFWPVTLVIAFIRWIISSIIGHFRVVPDEDLHYSVWEKLHEIEHYDGLTRRERGNIKIALNIGLDEEITLNILLKRGYISKTHTADVAVYRDGHEEHSNEKDHYYITSRGREALSKFYKG